jgi:diguanylate cyclase (GGDEF)-like protein
LFDDTLSAEAINPAIGYFEGIRGFSRDWLEAASGTFIANMPMNEETAQRIIELLSSVELDEVCAQIAKLVKDVTKSQFVCLAVWDPDLERLNDRFLFGDVSKDAEQFVGAFCEEFESGSSECSEIDEEAFSVAVPARLSPLTCYQIQDAEGLCACVLFRNADNAAISSFAKPLKQYPLVTALRRAWELQELQKENTRLRSSYDQLEDKTSILEEQTRKLIHDLTARDTMRTRHVERERLLYSISNVVRSYVDIQKVLATTVESIGATFGASRCILLKVVDNTDQVTVFEYTREFPSVKELFLTPQGEAFTHTALTKLTPHDLGDPEVEEQGIYDRAFLHQLGMRSGLIVPLVMRERVLGVLFLQDCSQPRAWSIDDISLIGSLADQVSVAIENAELHQEKERQAVTDGLTGIANRRCFSETLTHEFQRAKRYEQPLSLVLIDLDFLKVINDSFGHQIGDEAIKEVASLLKQCSRATDLAARYGGEEFCLLLPNTEVSMAEQLAERLKRLIDEVHIAGPGHISASFGVASYPIHALDPDSLFRRADEALYEAKQSGRDTVKVAVPINSASEQSATSANSAEQPSRIQSGRVVDIEAKESGSSVSK